MAGFELAPLNEPMILSSHFTEPNENTVLDPLVTVMRVGQENDLLEPESGKSG